MTIQILNRKRSRFAVVAIVLVTIALVSGFAAWRWAVRLQGTDTRHLAHNRSGMTMIRGVLDGLFIQDYPAFCKLPTNTIIRTSPEFVAALPPAIKEDYIRPSSGWSQVDVEKEGIVDFWGNWYNVFISVTNEARYQQTNFWVLTWSNGPNGKSEFNLGYGKGDDVAMEPFNITVGPSLPPQDKAWHPPLP